MQELFLLKFFCNQFTWRSNDKKKENVKLITVEIVLKKAIVVKTCLNDFEANKSV